MPFLALTKGSKKFGVQTYERAMRLAAPLKDAELQYLDVRDHYVNHRAILAQLDEALKQAKEADDKEYVASLGHRILGLQATLSDLRERTRLIGERSWAEAFVLASEHMLSKESLSAISIQADSLLGRCRHEITKSEG